MKKTNKSNLRGTEIEGYLLTATEKEVAKMEKPIGRKGLAIFWWLAVLAMIALGLRIFYLNVIKSEYYQKTAKGNQIRSVAIKAPRGEIIDRAGQVLAGNIPSIDAAIVPVDFFRSQQEKERSIAALSEILNINEGEIRGKLENADKFSANPILLKENISREEAVALLEKGNNLPGAVIEKTAVRNYIDGLIFSHILGYEGKITRDELEENPGYLFTDYIGKEGIEKSYEDQLRGINGALQVEVDSEGLARREIGTVNPQPGNSLILTVDAQLQKKIFDELNLILEKTETRTAAALAINPKNGEVLALVSLPSFDNNVFTKSVPSEEFARLINDPESPLFNRAIAGEYPPGSTIKPAVAAAALSENVINDSTAVNCGGGISIGNYHFGDWKTHGVTDVRKAIAESCDVFFYSVGGGYGNIPELGMERMKHYENLFGLGEKTGIDIPGEKSGFIPDEQWKLEKFGEKWYTGNSYHAAIGQGYITATPLQLANYISAIANGGTLYKPHLVSQIKKNEGGTVDIKPEIIRSNFVSKDALKIVQEGMRQAVISGTASLLNDLPVTAAGKTGTAQFGADNKTHAWFVSYAPYENPEIAMVVLVEGGGEGHSLAVPVTKEVYKWYFGDKK